MSLPSLSALEHHLLGLLSDHPAFGYELVEAVDTAPHATEVATAGSLSIYQALSALERRKWVDSAREQAGTGQFRTAYSITQSGQNALWLATDQALREPATSPSFRRGIAYAHVLSPGILESRLAASSSQLERQLERLDASGGGAPPHQRSAVRLERRVVEETLAWLRELKELLCVPEPALEEAAGSSLAGDGDR